MNFNWRALIENRVNETENYIFILFFFSGENSFSSVPVRSCELREYISRFLSHLYEMGFSPPRDENSLRFFSSNE